MAGPRLGPCSPWCSGEQVQALPKIVKAAAAAAKEGVSEDDVAMMCAEAIAAASHILYELSGRMYTGECGPMTIRPVSRPADADSRTLGASLSPMGWFSSWGLSSAYGMSTPGVMAHYGSTDPPTIKLPYTVTEIVQVLIDGVVIPGPYDPETKTGEWELRDFQDLVRIRPTADFNPTEAWGWPTSQIMDLPDTEEGTFSITFTFGTPPPASGVIGARKLAEVLVLPQLGDTSSYPSRVTQVARQGVTTQIASVIDLLENKSTGFYEIDLFLNAVNPERNQRQAKVWSPDVGRNRRQANPSLPT